MRGTNDLTASLALNENAIEKGRLEGEKEKALMIAQNLKKLGTMSDSEIAEVTSLPLPEVAAL